jgi:hypothetical protein
MGTVPRQESVYNSSMQHASIGNFFKNGTVNLPQIAGRRPRALRARSAGKIKICYGVSRVNKLGGFLYHSSAYVQLYRSLSGPTAVPCVVRAYEIMSSRAVAQPPASRFTPILGNNDLAYGSR